ncbi:MAG: gas vesicle protein [Arenicella sp.]|jgi:gas vesicle protein
MSNNSGNSFFAFLAGVSVGTLLGILYAPEKGQDTRDKLAYQLKDYKAKLQKMTDELIDGKTNATSYAKEMGEKLKQDTISQAEKLMASIDHWEKELQGKIKKGDSDTEKEEA